MVPLDVPAEIMRLDIWVMLACALLLLGLAVYRVNLNRLAGLALTAAYCAYIFVVYTFSITN